MQEGQSTVVGHILKHTGHADEYEEPGGIEVIGW